MEKEINFSIGFVTGRANVCKIINSYYQYVLDQLNEYDGKVNLTVYILYDLSYQYTKRTDFYGIIPEIYRKNIRIVYITPENIDEEKKKLIGRSILTENEVEMFLGHGHAKGRNTVMYWALKEKMDYLLFWDDDEYPYACMEDENGKVIWKKQNNVVDHIKYIEKEHATLTRGWHCGYISPIPYINCNEEVSEDDVKDFIEGISNEAVTWESIKEIFEKHGGVTFADSKIANGEGAFEILKEGGGKWIAGSTICLNMNDIDNIPAFYNPPGARGEDTFFSCLLDEAKVFRIPLYHFHDGFLKYTSIMNDILPTKLKRVDNDDETIGMRFYKASTGWIKYKPLLMYIQDKENYPEKIKVAKEKLRKSASKIDKLFENNDFTKLPDILEEYASNVEQHYEDFLETNRIWKVLKEKIKENKVD